MTGMGVFNTPECDVGQEKWTRVQGEFTLQLHMQIIYV